MTDRMTEVSVPGSGHRGLADFGRRDPVEMIERLREMARREIIAAQKVLDAPDEDFVVETYRGFVVQHNRERLHPKPSDLSTKEGDHG